jgi:23S rRNA pseudouridine1911/1915/1917 synthase
MAARTITVDSATATRLETLVHRTLGALSRRLVRRLIDEGAVRVNDRRARKGTRLRAGDVVLLPESPRLLPEPDLPVAVVYEDAALVVLDKPGGMPGHALDPRQRGSAAAFLLARYPETADVGELGAPGLVHRLDTGTSGLLVAARTPSSHAALRAAFRARQVEKHYLAIVEGTLTGPEGRHVGTPLARDPRDRRRMIPAPTGARAWPAETLVDVLAAGPRRSLVRARIRTGVTHQVRVHLALLGHPVVGDALYGTASSDLGPGRHALHAAEIALPRPAAGPPLHLRSELPAELQALAAPLRS